MVALQILAPELLAFEVVGGQFAIAEVSDDDLAIGHWGRAGVVVQLVKLLFGAAGAGARRFRYAGFARPDALSIGLVELQQQQLLILLRGYEDGVAPDGRRAGAPRRQFDLPGHVAFFAPDQRQALLFAGTIAARPAPLGPVFAPGASRQSQANAGGYEWK